MRASPSFHRRRSDDERTSPRRYHEAQAKLLQARVDDLEAELESARADAKKAKDYATQRIAALVARVDVVEGRSVDASAML